MALPLGRVPCGQGTPPFLYCTVPSFAVTPIRCRFRCSGGKDAAKGRGEPGSGNSVPLRFAYSEASALPPTLAHSGDVWFQCPIVLCLTIIAWMLIICQVPYL